MYSFIVISNDDSIHSFFKRCLKKDYVVYTAKTPEEALKIFFKRDIDIAFLDILLRDDGASKLVDELRIANIEPTIVALVPESQPMLSEEALVVGAYELQTPLKKEAVLQATNRAIERQELKRELRFIQSQLDKLKVLGNDDRFSKPAPLKQISNASSHLPYKEVFQKFLKVLSQVFDLKKLTNLTVEAMAEIFGVGKVVFLMIDKEEGVSRPYLCLGLDESTAQNISLPTNRGIMLWLTKNHQILNKDGLDRGFATNNLTKREVITIQKELDLLQAQLCIPIFARGNLISAITLGNKITGKVFFDEDIELLSMLAGYIGMAVENALLYKEVYLRKMHNENVLENIPCGIIAIGNNYKVNTFNESAAKMLNISSQEVIGKDVKHIGSIFSDILLKTLKDKKTYDMAEILHPISRSTYAVSTSLLLDTRGELGAILVFSDISEIKKLELRVKDLEKQAFFNMLGRNMAHYVKNHLVAVKTFMDLFPEKRNDEEFVKQFYSVAREKVSKLDLMVERLATLGEDNGLRKTRTDIRLPLDQVLDSNKGNMERFNIKLIKKYTEVPPISYADCEKLEEAFSNIVFNAIEAMPNGGILTVELSNISLCGEKLRELSSCLNNGIFPNKYPLVKISGELPSKYVEIKVQDTGNGISQEGLKNMFLPFYTTKVHNIGLGLSIARRIIEEHEGFIYVSTKEGKGSNFHILLPILN